MPIMIFSPVSNFGDQSLVCPFINIGYYLLGMLASARPGDGTEAVLSLAIHPIQNDIYVFALCKDHKIRMWLTSTNECVMVADVLCGQKQGQNQLLLGKLI